jgi:putative flavoprotein involved in K+ transport
MYVCAGRCGNAVAAGRSTESLNSIHGRGLSVNESVETVIVGGGQAGLAMSYCLSECGREHIILERARVAERWRTQRWDSLMFQFPNWSIELPGCSYRGPDPDDFSHKSDILSFLEDYAVRIKAPLRAGVEVLSLRRAPKPRGYMLTTSAGTFEARNVVVATGPYQRPRIPSLAAGIQPGLFQVHAAEYRNPHELPAGGVLVVGSGASGCQIAEELLMAGRQVFFAIGKHRRIPRRYRGYDAFWWRRTLGYLDQKAEDTPREQRKPPPLVTGVGGGHDVDIRSYAKDGMTLLGHVREIRDGRVALADDLGESLAEGDRAFDEFTSAVDDYLRCHGAGSSEVHSSTSQRVTPSFVDEIDLRRSNIQSVIWATGYDLDFRWVDLPILDARGEPVQKRGVTSAPGIYFLGLAWMHKVKSSFLCGVGEDARYLAERICP